MRIQVKGRRVHVSDDVREHVEKRFRKIAKQVSGAGGARDRAVRGTQPGDRRLQGAEATLHLKGVTLRARDASGDLIHAINLCSDEMAVQVKRHRDKRRKRRESRVARARRGSAGDISPAA